MATYKKRADGRYQKLISYTDFRGVRRRKPLYGKTVQELNANIEEFKQAIKEGLNIGAGDCTVAEWAHEWLSTYKEPHVGHKSMEGYRRDLGLIIKAIGGKPIKQIKQSDLQRILNTRAGLSGSAIRKSAMTMKALFKAATVNRMIPYNPAEGLTLPKQVDGSHRALTQAEIEAITSTAAAGHRFALPVMLMLYAGLRRGEAAAFQINKDVDFENNMLRITRAITWVQNQPVVKPPKSNAGKRNMPIFPPLLPYLQETTGYAATPAKATGQPITLQAFKLGFKDFMQTADINCTAHDLRHTWFTMLYDAGVDIKTAQRWGGHATAAMTMEIYTHLSAERETASAELIKNHFSKKNL